jgi:hypothetical protein
MQKFCGVPNVMGRSIYLIGSASIPETTPWNGVGDGRNQDYGMPKLSSVDTYTTLRLLPPSISTLWNRLVPNSRATTSG